MQPQTTDTPYHLRAARLRWAAFAVDLAEDEIEWVTALMVGSAVPAHTQALAKLLWGLHSREEISKLCIAQHISRRKLLELSDKLTTKEGRRLLLSQPQPIRGRPRKASRHNGPPA